jgi:hypothetical protein
MALDTLAAMAPVLAELLIPAVPLPLHLPPIGLNDRLNQSHGGISIGHALDHAGVTVALV